MDGPPAGNDSVPGAPGTLAPGDRIGRFELVVLVRGVGTDEEKGDRGEEDTSARGTVWLARERPTPRVERLVALTFASRSLAADPRFRDLLRQEVRLASSVAHPNVAQVLGLGEDAGALFVVSEWVEGDTLADLRAAADAKKQSIPPAILLRILADACGGLHAAHLLRDGTGNLLNVVHADVSSQSIVLAAAGVSRVVDLGFAKARARLRGGANVAWLDAPASQGGPRPPPGQRIDRHADVWGIGAILAQSLAPLVANGGPTPDGTGPNVPSLVSELILRARSTDPAERFATAAEMQGAIEAAMVTLGMPTSRAGVAAFVSEHLGDRMAKRAAAILATRVEDALGASLRPPTNPSFKPALSIPTPGIESVRATAHTAREFRVPGSPRPPNPALFAAGFAVAVLASGVIGYVGMRARDRVAAPVVAAAPAPPAVSVAPPPPRPSCPPGMTELAGSASCLDVAPVTTAAYKACSDSGDCKRAATENRWPGITAQDREAYDPLCRERDPKAHAQDPINCIDREMAALYCKSRGSRLPTEAESALTPNAPAGTFSEWGLRPQDTPTNRSYAVGFRCARSL